MGGRGRASEDTHLSVRQRFEELLFNNNDIAEDGQDLAGGRSLVVSPPFEAL